MKHIVNVLQLVQMGFRVIPCRPDTKIPALPNWPEHASRDEAHIRSWFATNPDANWAILLEPGMFVVDVPALTEWAGRPRTLMGQTPSGGTHFFYRGPVRDIAIKSLGNGIEAYGPGRTLMVEPSTIAGLHWKWINPLTPIADAPPDLVALVNGID